MDLKLQNKVAVIAGGSKGLGAAAARILAAEGARLFLAARTGTALDMLRDELRECFHAETTTLQVDLTSPQGADRIADAAVAAYGRIDILIYSAGSSQGGLFWEIPDAVWEQSFALKFMGAVRMMRAVIPAMRRQKQGRIVTVVGSTGRQPSARLLPGAAANAALLAVTKGLADELAPEGIIVNAINPGPTRTERWTALMQNLAQSANRSAASVEADFLKEIPSGRLAEPEEIARLIVFLASDEAANITGSSLTADGGWTRALA